MLFATRLPSATETLPQKAWTQGVGNKLRRWNINRLSQP